MRSEPKIELDERTEDLIRRSLDWQANQALAGEPVLERLRQPGAVPAHRRSAMMLVAAGAAAVVLGAVGIPLALHHDQANPASPTAAAGGTSTAPSTTVKADGVHGPIAMAYKATWLPDGFTEVSRETAVEPTVRDYPSGDVFPNQADQQCAVFQPHGIDDVNTTTMSPMIELCAAHAEHPEQLTAAPGRQLVTVKGAPGLLSVPPGAATVGDIQWQPSSTVLLSVTVDDIADPGAIAQRVAESVVLDGRPSVDVPLNFGYLPAHFNYTGFAAARVHVDGTGPDTTRALLMVGSVQSDGSMSHESQIQGGLLYGLLSRQPQLASPGTVSGARPVTVRGQSAWFVPVHQAGQRVDPAGIQVQVGSWWLTVELRPATNLSTSVLIDELTKIVNGVTVNTEANYSWLGQR